MENNIKMVQNRILDIMKYVDKICRDNNITYYIMGGTALGAVRHDGFIPWDDDLDVFMTIDNYNRFKNEFLLKKDNRFVLQEWKITDNYLEYSKVRMNGTTFIEECFKENKNMHHGIYVDIMILHKCPNNYIVKRKMYYYSKIVTVLGLLQRNWKPKTKLQKFITFLLKFAPKKCLSKHCYKYIYKFDKLNKNFVYHYFITKARYKQGIFSKEIFEEPIDMQFEDTLLLAPTNIKAYLTIRYGDYLRLPPKSEQLSSIHAFLYDTNKDYNEYMR